MAIDCTDLTKIERNFSTLIVERCKFCKFDQYLESHPDFAFPKITKALLGWENGQHITIPGMFGGFDYFLEEVNGGLVLYAEQSSRMDYSGDDYMYFEITKDGSRMLEGEERETVRKKFWELAKRAHLEHMKKSCCKS